MTIESHGTAGSEARSDILKMLVDMDEAAIATKSDQLYARTSAEVRGALRSAIPSVWLDAPARFGVGDVWLAAPNFPVLMPTGAKGEFCESIISAQASLIEFTGEGLRKRFRFIDSRNQGEAAGRSAWSAMTGWMTANSKAMTASELLGLDSAGGEFSSNARAAFIAGLDAIMAKASSIAEFDAAVLQWFESAYPWVTGVTIGQIESGLRLSSEVAKARAKLDDGSVRYDLQIKRSVLIYSPLRAELNRTIVEKFAAGAMNEDLATILDSAPGGTCSIADAMSYLGSEKSDKIAGGIAKIAAEALGGLLEGSLIRIGDDSPYAEKLRAAANAGRGAVPLLDHDSLLDYEGITSAVRAYAAKKKQEALGLDVDGLLAAISNNRDIISAKVGMVNYEKMKDKFTGAYVYDAGEYACIEMHYGSGLQKRFSDRTDGLEGRYFNSTKKYWMISLVPAKFSDGKPVADILAFAKFLNIDITPFKKAAP